MIDILKTINGMEPATCRGILYAMKARVKFFHKRAKYDKKNDTVGQKYTKMSGIFHYFRKSTGMHAVIDTF